jgi:hypothetical protein
VTGDRLICRHQSTVKKPRNVDRDSYYLGIAKSAEVFFYDPLNSFLALLYSSIARNAHVSPKNEEITLS